MSSNRHKWQEIPSAVTAALATIAETVQAQNVRLDGLEVSSLSGLGHRLEQQISGSGSLLSQQTDQLRQVASAVERLTAATATCEHRQRQGFLALLTSEEEKLR